MPAERMTRFFVLWSHAVTLIETHTRAYSSIETNFTIKMQVLKVTKQHSSCHVFKYSKQMRRIFGVLISNLERTSSIHTCVGSGVGPAVGFGVGTPVGNGVGANVGCGVGAPVGNGVGPAVGPGVGTLVGSGVGMFVGLGVGTLVGNGVGANVG